MFEWLFDLATGIFENEIGKEMKDLRGGYLQAEGKPKMG